jgi:hypothetical protein
MFQLALRGALPTEIAEYLREIVSERMGLPSTIQTELPIAEKIRALKCP